MAGQATGASPSGKDTRAMRIFTPWTGRSFSGKVLLAVMGILTLLTCTFTWFSLTSQRDSFEKEVINDGNVLAKLLAENVRLGIFTREEQQLATPAQAILDLEGVVAVCVFDQNGELLLRRTNPAWVSDDTCRRSRKLELPAAGAARQGVSTALHLETLKTEEFWTPVVSPAGKYSEEELYFTAEPSMERAGQQLIGTVGVVFDRSGLQHNIREILARHALILIFFLALGATSSFFLIKAVTRPLNRLVSTISKQADLPVDADELSALSSTFDSMVGKLGSSFATITDLNKELEEKVLDLEEEILLRRRSEESLRESEEKFRSISEGIADGVAIVHNGVFAWQNRSFCQIFGCCSKEMQGREAKELIPWPLSGTGEPWRPEQLSSEERQGRYQIEIRRKDGKPALLECQIGFILFQQERSLQVIIRDITDRVAAERVQKDMEVKALSQSKLASLGKIATAVAHEINQPLSYIKIVFEAALRDLESGQPDINECRVNFEEALRQVGRITLITEHLRSFGRSDTSSYTLVRLPDILKNSLTLMSEVLRLGGVRLEQAVTDDLPAVKGNSVQLEQVFINLFQNSVDALAQIEYRRIRVSMGQAGGMIRVNFADSGPGIPADLRPSVFQPFYSTKAKEDRTGLGLAIVNSIVREHGGSIEYREEDGSGANFIITLPAAS